MTAKPKKKITPEEYLEIERNSEERSQYFNGEIFDMAGASRKHNLISGNIFAAIHGQIRNRDCEVYMNDMRVKVCPAGLYTYPDVTVVCDTPQFDDEHNDTLTNPSMIVEVMSESTEAYDRGAKFEQYRKIESLTDYLLVSQEKRHVEQYVRQAGNSWLFMEFSGPDETIRMESVLCELTVSEIYAKTEMEELKR